MTGHIHQFRQLNDLLTRNREFWQFMPFAERSFVWNQTHPGLCQWLISLTEEQVTYFNEDNAALAEALSTWIPDSPELYQLSQCLSLPVENTAVAKGLDVGIPGRKWTQISAFSAALPRLQLPWLEWCAGKGHLGRILAANHHMPVTSLEWQRQLCVEGEATAKRLGLPITFITADAFDKSSEQYIQPQQHAVALHACGDLHVSLLQRVVAKQGAAVSISPCCYHLIRAKHYQPLSDLAKQSEITLTKHDLRLPLQETVTAGQRVRRQRFVEVSYRLGFDLLQRELRGCDDYLPVPNVQKALLNEGFSAFCFWAAEKKSLLLPGDIDFAYWQQEGEARYQITERMELVRQLFRRPLEMWLVYDRVCFLEQSGYQVSLGTFCAKPVTPRNILIHAELKTRQL
ncbi:methyltransferase [Photobacterium lipolyticum]|uniref:SAM-dependent methyltransferase n=1 Tax=Photobacterium lipolyticum TaxID=266810 RepID=A0A2T3N4J7_9GAMM|nr:methyltransferase [Photobacterium lipolyticum]PSW07357.1 SAM-dependent methyltransferase [Photobacterium lipolyticum]